MSGDRGRVRWHHHGGPPKLQPYRPASASIAIQTSPGPSCCTPNGNMRAAHASFPCNSPTSRQSAAHAGLEVGGYDLVVATDLLHATNIAALWPMPKRHCAKAVLLLLNELNRSALFVHLTLASSKDGGTYGRFTALRLPGVLGCLRHPGHGCWPEEGFRNVFIPARPATYWATSLVAQSDGVDPATTGSSQKPAGAIRPGFPPLHEEPNVQSPSPIGRGPG